MKLFKTTIPFVLRLLQRPYSTATGGLFRWRELHGEIVGPP